MPELPEVETIKRDLEKIIVGKKIVEVCVHHPTVVREPTVKEFKKGLEGASIKNVLRRAKVLILELSNGKSLVIHLKMTGQLVYPGNGEKPRVSFNLSNGKSLDFNDQRLFAELRLMDDWKSLKFIQGLGPEPFDLTLDKFKKMLENKRTKIKPLLMDQSFISGIGNLYASEILFRSKIHPERPANSLSDKEREGLFKQTREVLNDAIRYKGSSIDDYVRVSGGKGNYVSQHKIYGRQGLPCLVCRTLIKKINLGGRGTYFCSKCQR
ncbi:MAG: DNA-formamidopyrimidine glycosylase [Candidatus Omnitrophota bacterium]|nr:DNA-formamidopyrimidine glycosylase [Candidatus Omnitrophota bacterium]MBU1929855.1 DNA-formamidopyrimidine glycosylase [Candidatus Omnitrophota bacterium]MBU2034668.1 DNA-formamidopyrimidine glycosylase [Candidatus Omnitrophota bacterium]MBU2221990.1 DNA-formamidopyrimidine glycosylase [Candidatus Omnitrophota bacterium]MBU2258225.1 DNA-formamidopyrimidine glycosylase [Candidatus Omnitrophota bacterium]